MRWGAAGIMFVAILLPLTAPHAAPPLTISARPVSPPPSSAEPGARGDPAPTCDLVLAEGGPCRVPVWAVAGDTVRSLAFAVSQGTSRSSPQAGKESQRPCRAARLPRGFAVTRGIPHARLTPYPDPTRYNPTSIANFIRTAVSDTRTTAAQKRCLALLGGRALLAGSVTRKTPSGRTALWFPYGFEFKANPSLPALEPGWISGLGQSAALGALGDLYALTKDRRWHVAATLTFESYTVRLADGGFTHEIGGGLWFEEYPTSPPTSVLNGHLNALTALVALRKSSRDLRVGLMVERAVVATKRLLPLLEVPVANGIASSYDLARGHGAAPLRVATASGLRVLGATHVVSGRDTPIDLAVEPPVPQGANLLRNSGFTGRGRVPSGWTQVRGNVVNLARAGGAVSITGNGRQSQTLGQVVPASRVVPGATYRLSWRGKVSVSRGGSATSGQTLVVASCPRGERVLGANDATRSRTFAGLDLVVTAPRQRCSLHVLLRHSDWRVAGSTVTYDDVTLTRVDPLAGSARVRWPISASAPARLTIRYVGAGELQAYDNGRWWRIVGLNSAVPATATVVVPERWTGRNIHYGYHSEHVEQLLTLHRLLGEPLFLEYAQRWRGLAL